jgi:hypothetical protein
MIWDFQDAFSRRLTLWSALSIVVGIGLLVFGDPFWRGLGLQALVWGGIDAIIVFFGQRASRIWQAAGPHAPEAIEGEARSLRRLLQRFTNDVAYLEVDGEHNLTLSDNPAWPAAEAAVVKFAQSIKVSDVS